MGLTDASPGIVDRHAPIDPDHVGARLGHEPEQLAGTDAEVDARNPEVGETVEDAS